jgi:hypothetical protein
LLRRINSISSGTKIPRRGEEREMTHAELNTALAKLGWNQGDLARETGYQRGEISRMCTGKRKIPLILERFLELKLELQMYREAALYDACMSGPVFKGWNRSTLDRARKVSEERQRPK